MPKADQLQADRREPPPAKVDTSVRRAKSAGKFNSRTIIRAGTAQSKPARPRPPIPRLLAKLKAHGSGRRKARNSFRLFTALKTAGFCDMILAVERSKSVGGMDFDEALKEFVGFLTIGSSALRNLMHRTARVDAGKTYALLDEVDQIADRLAAIAEQIAGRTNLVDPS